MTTKILEPPDRPRKLIAYGTYSIEQANIDGDAALAELAVERARAESMRAGHYLDSRVRPTRQRAPRRRAAARRTSSAAGSDGDDGEPPPSVAAMPELTEAEKRFIDYLVTGAVQEWTRS